MCKDFDHHKMTKENSIEKSCSVIKQEEMKLGTV